jgi:uncharacterized protein
MENNSQIDTKKTRLQSKIFDKVVIFKSHQGTNLAFHSHNLELAEVSQDLWDNKSDALKELQSWNNENLPQSKTEKAKAKINTLNVNVTQICNLHCSYCAAAGDGTYGNPQKKIAIDKTIPQLSWFLDRLEEGDSFSITMLGGEPLLYPEGIRLLSEYLRQQEVERNIKISLRVVTNGTLFTEPIVEILNKFQIDVTISMDGPAEINDRVRPSNSGTSSTQQIEMGLKQLFEKRNRIKNISVRGVFGKHNLEVLKAYNYFSQYTFDSMEFNFDITCNDPDVSEQFQQQMLEIFKKAAEKGEENLRKLKFIDTVFKQMDLQKRTENYCGSGKSFAVIDASNQVFRCPWEVSEVKNKVTKLSEQELQTIEKTLIEENNCKTCWAQYLCGGGCMYAHQQTTGAKNRPDPVYCNRTRNLLLSALMYYYSYRKVDHE